LRGQGIISPLLGTGVVEVVFVPLEFVAVGAPRDIVLASVMPRDVT